MARSVIPVGSRGVVVFLETEDSEGQWIVGFVKSTCANSSIAAKLLALREGLSLCVERDCHAVEIELLP